MKQTLIAVIISFLAGGGSAGAVVKFWADHTYELQTTADETHNTIRIELAAVSDEMRAASNRQRVLQLQGWIDQLHRNAERKERALTTSEKNDIREWQTEINNLKGW